MDLYDVNAFSSDEEVRRPKTIRYRRNHYEEWDEVDFFARFRLSKRCVANVLEQIEETITYPTLRNDCLSAQNQLLLALRFYATGSFLSVAGDFCGIHKSTASKTIKRVSRALASLRPAYIRMPDYEEIFNIRQSFYNIARFPKCIGAIDCSHVKIQSPGGNNAELFRNRKQFFSINVQTISDADLKIRDIVARWPDSHIFRNSVIRHTFEQGIFGDNVLVGDSGYPIKPYLITPLRNTNNEPENLFNESLIRTRNVVERSYGVWKRQFPCLALGLRLNLDTTMALIVATAVLHNIACEQNERDVAAPSGDEVQERNRGGLNNETRFNLIYNYFARL
ncbi:hypothetical protein Zmor_006005 [Zophobas morio]|uniref:DDE Tnp4 domain-containing protein n=1 Tax=Zophobas morio TaxID=2755281 RepID=A0AA38IWQ0_9CUCU|nr:hypothetical protein Zmor_006005 [Zophobas morio]